MGVLTLRRPTFPLTLPRFAGHLHALGLRQTVDVLAEQLWYTKRFFGLRCELAALPDVRAAKIPIAMEPVDPGSFAGFDDELERASGSDYVQVLLRQRLCQDGVSSLYVASDPNGRPIYAQWLTSATEQDAIHAHAPGRYPQLGDDEVLLEGAYTFSEFRQLGAMRDGMAQLLRIAASEGARAAFTYVEAHNVPSLRGCEDVGFAPDHLRASIRRLGLRRGTMRSLRDDERTLWARATAR